MVDTSAHRTQRHPAPKRRKDKEGKKGSDKGIDGIMVFTDDNSGKAKKSHCLG